MIPIVEQKVEVPYRPRPLQREIGRLCREKRFGVLVCHRRFGKTVLGVNLNQQTALMTEKERPRAGYVGPTYTQAKTTAWDYMQHYAQAIPSVAFNQSELRVDYPNGGQSRIFGADNPDSLRGIYLDRAVMDEFGLHPPHTFSEIIGPTLVDRGGSALILGTPNGKNQFYDMAQLARAKEEAGDKNWFYREYKASETGLLDRDYLSQAKAMMTEDEYQQEFECVPPGTLIATAGGYAAIESLRAQENVLTHRGRWRPIVRVMSRPFTGNLCLIHAYGALSQPLRCTPEHPIALYDRASQRTLWKPAREVAEGDYLLLPHGNSRAVPMICEAWASLIGWYIGEGSVNGNSVTFSLNPFRPSEAATVRECLNAVGAPVSSSDDGRISSCSVDLADTLTALCGSLAENKRIPFTVISGRESQVFDALMLADGCSVEPVQGGHRWSYTTVSRGLAYDVQLLAAMLGRRAGIVVRPARVMTSPGNGRNYPTLQSYSVQIPKGTRVNHGKTRDAHPCTRGVAYRVSLVSHVPYDGPVYNLSVKEDESFVAEGRAVHNCSFEAAVKGAIYSKEMEAARVGGRITHVPYESMLPVDTDWDLGIGDAMAIWFSQTLRSGEIHIIDYHEASGEGFPYYIQVLRSKGYIYGKHWAPHDIQVRELSSGRSRLEVAASLGIQFDVVPRLQVTSAGELEEGIHALRMLFPRLWFDKERCKAGIEALMHYRRDYNSRLNEFKATPVHDWACFSPETEILTPSGSCQIQCLPQNEEVLTPCGWKRYEGPRVTRRDVPVVEVAFSDGSTVSCTADHLFLTESGWTSAQHLQKGTEIQSYSTRSPSITTGGSSGYGLLNGTLPEEAPVSIVRSGLMSLVLFLTGAMSTIATTIVSTTASTIWNVFQLHNISLKLGTVPSLASPISPPTLAPRRQSGTVRKSDGCGTNVMQSGVDSEPVSRERRGLASIAAKTWKHWFGRLDISKSTVVTPVKPLLIESVTPLPGRRDVWCIHVPDIGCFCLANGAVVHNSHAADAARGLAVRHQQPKAKRRNTYEGMSLSWSWS